MADRVVPGPVDSSACVREADFQAFFNTFCLVDIQIV